MDLQSIGTSDFKFFNGETNVTAQQRFSPDNVRLWLIIRMAIAVEKVTSSRNFGREVFRETIARSRLRFKNGRLFD